MVDRVILAPEETGPTPPVVEEKVDRPEWLPEKFKTPEDFAKSYTELEASHTRLKQGKPDPEKPEEKKPEEKLAEEKKPDLTVTQDDPAKKVVEASGFDVAPFSTEFATSGDVAEESRAKIAEGLKGVLGDNARAIVDQYIEGQKVVAQNDHVVFMNSAGGEDTFKAMVTWAKEALPKEQVVAYNNAVQSGDRHATIFAIEGLKAKFEAANGKLPSNPLKPGAAQPSGSVQAFQSSAQMTAAMKDPRYKTDQGYRNEVAARIKVSNF